MQKMGWFGQLGVTQGQPQCRHRQSAYDFLFDFNRNHASIFYRFRDTTAYLLKVADFDPPHLHLAPPQGLTPVEFRGDLWHQKTRVPGLSCGVVCVILRLAVLVEHRLVTDRRTQAHGQYCRCIALCGKNSLDLHEARDDGVLGCSGISWTICKQSHRSRQITTPTSHHSIFTGPTYSVKALKTTQLQFAFSANFISNN